jgi:hypothetical protein
VQKRFHITLTCSGIQPTQQYVYGKASRHASFTCKIAQPTSVTENWNRAIKFQISFASYRITQGCVRVCLLGCGTQQSHVKRVGNPYIHVEDNKYGFPNSSYLGECGTIAPLSLPTRSEPSWGECKVIKLLIFFLIQFINLNLINFNSRVLTEEHPIMIGLCVYAEGSDAMRVSVADDNRPPSLKLHWDDVKGLSTDRKDEWRGLPDGINHQIEHMNIKDFMFTYFHPVLLPAGSSAVRSFTSKLIFIIHEYEMNKY